MQLQLKVFTLYQCPLSYDILETWLSKIHNEKWSFKLEKRKEIEDVGYLWCTLLFIQISVDIDGSIEMLEDFTTPEQPFFYYDIEKQENTFDGSYKDGKIIYLAMDFLPS